MGGVLINPGDVVVADGDGVIVVPKGIVREVAKYARRELTNDEAVRGKPYEARGWEPDETVTLEIGKEDCQSSRSGREMFRPRIDNHSSHGRLAPSSGGL